MKRILIILSVFLSVISYGQKMYVSTQPDCCGTTSGVTIDTTSLSNRINLVNTLLNNHRIIDDTIIGNEVDSIWKSNDTFYIQKGINIFSFLDSANGSNNNINYKLYSESYDSATFVPNIATGLNAVSIGVVNSASGNNSFAIGAGTTASGTTATSFGSNTIASGISSTAIGESTTASGDYSTSIGNSTFANGNNSTSIGSNTIAQSYNEIAIGSSNTNYTPISSNSFEPTDRLLVVGNGSIVESDAFTILKNGKIGIGYNNFETTTFDEILQVNGGIKANLPIANQDSIIGVDTNGIFYKMPYTSGGASIDTTSLSNRINAKQDSQSLSIVGNVLSITRGNSITLPTSSSGADTTNDAWKNTTGLVSLTTLSNGVARNDTANIFIRDNGAVRIGGNVDLGLSTPKVNIIHGIYDTLSPHALTTGSTTVTSPTGIYLRSTTKSYLTYGSTGNLIFDRATVPRTEVMRLTTTNRLGLLTQNPTTTLDVNGTFRVRQLSNNNSDTILSIIADGTVYKKYVPIQYNTTNNSTSINSSGALILPKGTTAQRPTIGVAGMERFNTTYNGIEFYDGTNWILIRAVLSADPVGYGAGSTYYSTTTGTMRFYNGTIWSNY